MKRYVDRSRWHVLAQLPLTVLAVSLWFAVVHPNLSDPATQAGGLGQVPDASGTPLFARNYTVVPTPQQVALRDREFQFDSTWRLIVGKGVPATDSGLEVLKEELKARFQLTLRESSSAADVPAVLVDIQPGSVT